MMFCTRQASTPLAAAAAVLWSHRKMSVLTSDRIPNSVCCEEPTRGVKPPVQLRFKLRHKDILAKTADRTARFDDTYENIARIGKGNFGIVDKVRHRNSGQMMAVKRIPKESITVQQFTGSTAFGDRMGTLPNGKASFERELEVFQEIVHPHIVTLHDFFVEDDAYVLTMRLCEGPDLKEYLDSEIEKRSRLPEWKVSHLLLPEWKVSQLLRHMLKALDGLQVHGIIHKDIKPSNFRFWRQFKSSSAFDVPSLVLLDFGISEFFEDGDIPMRRGPSGTQRYIAPEVWRREYSSACDMWSLGITLYIMLLGSYPSIQLGKDASHDIQDVEFAHQYLAKSDGWTFLSNNAQDLLMRLLTPDPSKRISPYEALQHNFIVRYSWLGSFHKYSWEEQVNYLKSALDNMRHFNRAPALLRLALVVHSHQTYAMGVSSEYQFLFRMMNERGDGRFTYRDMSAFLSIYGLEVPESHALFDIMAISNKDYCNLYEFLAATIEPDLVHEEKHIRNVWHELVGTNEHITYKVLEEWIPEKSCCQAILDEATDAVEWRHHSVSTLRQERVLSFDDFKKLMLAYGHF